MLVIALLVLIASLFLAVIVAGVMASAYYLTISVPNVPGVYTLTIVANGRPTLAVQPEIIVLNPDGPVPPPLSDH